jgi:hypothetical protein
MQNPFLTYANDILAASHKLTSNLQQNRNWMGNQGATLSPTTAARPSRSGARGSKSRSSRSRSGARGAATPATPTTTTATAARSRR